jgi:hypothetical protein
MSVGPQISEWIRSKWFVDILVDEGKNTLVCFESLKRSQSLESRL